VKTSGACCFPAVSAPFPSPRSAGLGSSRGAAAKAALAAQGSGRGCRQLPALACSSRHGFLSPATPESAASRAADRAVLGALGMTPLVALPSQTCRPEPAAAGTRQEGGTQPVCVRSYKGGSWPRSLQTTGLVFEFWLLLRGYLYVGFFFFLYNC